MSSRRCVTASGYDVTYELVRKQIKRINLRVKQDGQIYVSAPLREPLERIDDFVISCEELIKRGRLRFQALEEEKEPALHFVTGEKILLFGQRWPLQVNYVALRKEEGCHLTDDQIILSVRETADEERRHTIFQQFWQALGQAYIGQIMDEVQQEFSASPYGQAMADSQVKEFRLRAMKSRWGSCMPRRQIITLNSHLLAFETKYIYYVLYHEFAHLIEANHSERFYAVLAYFEPQWQLLRKELTILGRQWETHLKH